MTPDTLSTASIGLFDSGVGGLSVLRSLERRLPAVPLHYLADAAYAPYGDLPAPVIVERSQRLVGHLLASGARLIVVACNTATALAIDTLRDRWPDVPFVGVEPGVKPAAGLTRNGRIGVMATSGTIGSGRLQRLVEEYGAACEVVLQACPGLADAIEDAAVDEQAMRTVLRRHCDPLREAGVDTVVLGCTHYPFVAPAIRSLMGAEVTLVDTADAVAQRAETLWRASKVDMSEVASEDRTTRPAPLRIETTGIAEPLSAFAARWLERAVPATRVSGV